jgi:hypothetical protein
MQGFVNQLSQAFIVNRARLAWMYFVIEPCDYPHFWASSKPS